MPLFHDAHWAYYNKHVHVRTNKGAYLICDNGYLHWPMTICPFTSNLLNTLRASVRMSSVRLGY